MLPHFALRIKKQVILRNDKSGRDMEILESLKFREEEKRADRLRRAQGHRVLTGKAQGSQTEFS